MLLQILTNVLARHMVVQISVSTAWVAILVHVKMDIIWNTTERFVLVSLLHHLDHHVFAPEDFLGIMPGVSYLVFHTWDRFLIKHTFAFCRFFPRFLRCDSQKIMKLFFNKMICEFTGNLH